jgi:hypothetical protein
VRALPRGVALLAHAASCSQPSATRGGPQLNGAGHEVMIAFMRGSPFVRRCACPSSGALISAPELKG